MKYVKLFEGFLNENKILTPGFYTVVETDHGGSNDVPQFDIHVTEPIDYVDAYKQLERKGYKSPWGYLKVRANEKITPKDVKFTIPERQTKLDF
jgi:hypothetical protein